MAKVLKSRVSLYDVTASVVIKRADGAIAVVEWSGEGSATKSVRAIKSAITDSYKDSDSKVLAIDNIKAVKRVITMSYKIDASVVDIVDACVAAGIEVITDITDSNGNDANSDNEETDETE